MFYNNLLLAFKFLCFPPKLGRKRYQTQCKHEYKIATEKIDCTAASRDGSVGGVLAWTRLT